MSNDHDPTSNIDEDPSHPRIWPPPAQNHATDSRYTLPPPNPPKTGHRTPNGLPWAHTPRDFYRVVLPPGDAIRIWSRSMIQEAWGEDAFDYEHGKGKQKEKGELTLTPRIRRPWPVLGLCLRNEKCKVKVNLAEEERRLGMGVIDEESDHEDSKFETREGRGEERLDWGMGVSAAEVEECRDLVRWGIDNQCIDELCNIIKFPSFDKMRHEIEGSIKKTANMSAYLENVHASVGVNMELGKEVENGVGVGEPVGKKPEDDGDRVDMGIAVSGGVGEGTKMVSEGRVEDGTTIFCSEVKSGDVSAEGDADVDVEMDGEGGKGAKNGEIAVVGGEGEGTKMVSEGRVEGATIISCSGSEEGKSGEVDGSAGNEFEGDADVEMDGVKIGEVSKHSDDDKGKCYMVERVDRHVNVTGEEPMSTTGLPKEQVSSPVDVGAVVNGELDGTSSGPLDKGPITKPEAKKADDGDNMQTVNAENVTMTEDIGKVVESNANGGEGTKVVSEGDNILSVEGGVDTSCSGSEQVKSDEVDVIMSSAGNEVIGNADVEMIVADGEGKGVKNDHMEAAKHPDDNVDMKIDDLPEKQVSNPKKTHGLVEATAVVSAAASGDDVPSNEVEPPGTTLHWKRKDQILRLLNTFNQRWRRLRSTDPDMTSNICHVHVGKQFEIEGVPKLEEWIPERYLPERLIVDDPDHVTSLVGSRPTLKMYRNVFPGSSSMRPTGGENSQVSTSTPMTEGDADPFRPRTTVAHLSLSESARLGSGSHSYVYRAVLQLPEPLMARDSPNAEVTIAAKVSTHQAEDRALLSNEGIMYARFEKHLAEDWCGFNSFEGEEALVRPRAVVPKCYGYYVSEERHSSRDSAILLLEECGTPVEPEKLTHSQRVEMYSLYRLLHHAKYLQMSTYVRNMLVQPGPLTVSPSQRSMKTPSFRIIDFGRGDVIGSKYNDGDIRYEQKKALRELVL